MSMKLITKAIMKKTPPLGTFAQAELKDLKFSFKLFTPWGNWTWYVAEADFETGRCFGLVEGFERELGYFCLNELQRMRGAFGVGIERDLHWTPKSYAELTKE